MIATIAGSLVSYQSKTQPIVTLSSTEAEYVALTSCVKEALFLHQLIKGLTYEDKQIIMFEDNQGAIFLANNHQVSQRTKHIDIR